MVQPTGGTQSLSTADPLILTGTQSGTSADFAEQLATALEGVLQQQSGNGSQIEIDIQTGQGSSSGQYTITMTDAPAAAATSPSASGTAVQTPAASSQASSTTPASSSSVAVAAADDPSGYGTGGFGQVGSYGYTPAQEFAVATGEATNPDGSASPVAPDTTTWALQQMNEATSEWVSEGYAVPPQFGAAFDTAMGYPIPPGTAPYDPAATVPGDAAGASQSS